MPSLGESLREVVGRTRIPPQEWFSTDFQPLVVESIRKVYHAFRIDPAPLYTYERYLGRGNVRQGNICLWILAALADSAQEELEKQEREDRAVQLPEGSPFEALHQRGGLPADQPDQDGNEPAWQTNSAFQANPDSRFRPAQDRSGRLEPSAEVAARETNSDRPRAYSEQLPEPTNREPTNPAGSRDAVFEANIAARDAVFQTRRARTLFPAAEAPSQPQVVEPSNGSILFGSVSRAGTGPPSGSAQANTEEGRPEGPSEPHQNVAVLTPLRRPQRSHSSPHLSADAGMASAANIGKIKESERRHVESLKLSFGLDSYLDDFVARAAKALQRALHLDAGEKAELLLPMLQNEVTQRLVGRQELITPESPEQIFQVLRNEFPPRFDQNLVDLSGCAMGSKESATAFVHRAKQVFVRNQVPLPIEHSKILAVYMNGTPGFVKHCQDSIQTRKIMRQGEVTAKDPLMNWGQLQDFARDFDSSRALMNGIKGRSTEATRLGSGQIQDTKLRSGRTLAVTEPAVTHDHEGADLSSVMTAGTGTEPGLQGQTGLLTAIIHGGALEALLTTGIGVLMAARVPERPWLQQVIPHSGRLLCLDPRWDLDLLYLQSSPHHLSITLK